MTSTMEKNKAKDSLVFFLGIIFIGCLIQIAGKAKGDSLVFPGLAEILKSFFRLIRTAKTYQLVLTSIIHLSLALLFASLIGLTLGIIEGLSKFFQNFFRPLMILIRSIPMIVLVVVIMVLADYEFVPYLASTIVLVPLISEAACEGCRNIDPALIDVYKINGAFSLRVLFSVYFPLMSGYLRQAYVSAVGMGVKIVVSSEYLVQSRNSLGKAVFSSAYFNDYADIYAYALIMICLVLIVTALPMLFIKEKD